MAEVFDALIVGAGHNGLVAAACLARAGKRVLVLERQPQVGGAAVTEELFPGFRFSSVAEGTGRLVAHVAADLQLHKHGLTLLPIDPLLTTALPDGGCIRFWRDTARTAAEIARHSQADGARWPDFCAAMQRLAAVVARLMVLIPPALPAPGGRDLLELLKLVAPARRLSRKELGDLIRTLPMPVSDMLDEWFECDALKAALAVDGVHGVSLGPRQAGTAFVWLMALAAGQVPAFSAASQLQGGAGALTQAIAKAATSMGAQLRLNAAVQQVVVKDGRASGVVLASGEEISARVVVSNADPRTTFQGLIDPVEVDPVFLRSTCTIKYRGCTARMHLALSGVPRFAFDAAARIRVAPSINYIEQASDAAKYGSWSRQPWLDATLPTLVDATLAPPGQHVLSVHAQYAPYHLRSQDWDTQRAALGAAILSTLAQFAPDVPQLVLHSQVLTPLDLERNYGLPEGSATHGEMTLDQALHMRPLPDCAQYRTPIKQLYLCGAGTHPGGGGTGINGHNAARQVLRDWG